MSPPAGGHFPESPMAGDAPQYLAAHLRSPDPRLPSPIPERSSPPPPLQGTSSTFLDSRSAMRSPPPLLPMPNHRQPHPLQTPYHHHHHPHYQHQNAGDSNLSDHRLSHSATAVKTEPMDSPFQSSSSPWTALDRRRTPTPPSQFHPGIPALPKQEPLETQSDSPAPNRPPRPSYLHKIFQHKQRIRHQMQPVEEESDILERREQQRRLQYLDAIKRLNNTEVPHSAGGQHPPDVRDSPKIRRYSGPQNLAQYQSSRSSPPPLPPPPVSMAHLLSGIKSMLFRSIICTEMGYI